jgi:hypothetical protein
MSSAPTEGDDFPRLGDEAMRKWFAATLLVAVIAAIGCNDTKKATKTTTTTGTADKSAPADKNMPAPDKK